MRPISFLVAAVIFYHHSTISATRPVPDELRVIPHGRGVDVRGRKRSCESVVAKIAGHRNSLSLLRLA